MGDLLTDQSFVDAFSNFVAAFPDSFHVTGKDNLPTITIPSLKDEASPLTLPIPEDILSKLKSVSNISPYGHGTETKVDKNVRTGMEIESNNFILQDFLLDSRTNPILEKIRRDLAEHVQYIVAEPYKILIYETGGFFKPHVDTKYKTGHFGTLVLSLPTEEGFEGGKLRLTFEEKVTEWDASPSKGNTAPKMDWVAFYTDISHEITPVTKGCRVTLSLNLIVPEECRNDKRNFMDLSQVGKSLASDHEKKMIEALRTTADNLFELELPQPIAKLIYEFTTIHQVIDEIERILSMNSDPSVPEYNHCIVCVLFSHRYTSKEMDGNGDGEVNIADLKGRDVAIYATLSNIFHSFLTICRVNAVVGVWSDEEADSEDDYEGKVIEEWDEKDSRCTWKVFLGEYWDTPKWLDKTDFGFPDRCKVFTAFVNKAQTLTDCKRITENELNYGNIGAYDVNNQYSSAGLVIVKSKISTVQNPPKTPRKARRKRKISENENQSLPNKKPKT